jgi:hypothetical protein
VTSFPTACAQPAEASRAAHRRYDPRRHISDPRLDPDTRVRASTHTGFGDPPNNADDRMSRPNDDLPDGITAPERHRLHTHQACVAVPPLGLSAPAAFPADSRTCTLAGSS